MNLTTKQFKLNLTFDVVVDVTNDSTDRQKEFDAKVAIIKWVNQELNIPSGSELDISNGYGEIVIHDNEYINAEVL
jgi:hypothetical protein